MTGLIATLALAVSANVFAQTNTSVVPFGLENQNGNGNDSLFTTPGQTQQLIRGSYLANSWKTPVELTGIAFRVDGGLSMTPTIPRVEIRVSTTTVTPENMSVLYNANKGQDESVVFLHDNVSLFARGGQSINPFDLRFSFDRPFIYDPKNGNLLMSIVLSGGITGSTAQIDSQEYASLFGAPAGFVGPLTQGQVASVADITEFSYLAVPEAQARDLVLIGGLIMFAVLRRK